MKMTKKVINNRNNLIHAMALVEDITRTNNGIYELLKGLMSNPQGLTSIEKSIDNLYKKVTNLKNSDIGTPLIEEENAVVPGPQDMSPKEDIEYEKLVQTLPESEEDIVEEAEAEQTVEETPRETRKSRRDARRNARAKRPRRPLRKKKTSAETDLQD